MPFGMHCLLSNGHLHLEVARKISKSDLKFPFKRCLSKLKEWFNIHL